MKFVISMLLNSLIFYNCSISQGFDSSATGKNQELKEVADYNTSTLFVEGNNEYCDSIPTLIDKNKIDSLLLILNGKVEGTNNPFSPPGTLKLNVSPDDKITLLIEDYSKRIKFIKNFSTIKMSGIILLDANYIRQYFIRIEPGTKLYFTILKNNMEEKIGVVVFSYYSYWICF